MKRSALLFLLLAGIFGVGRAVADEDTAHAVKGVVLLRDLIADPDSVLLSRVLIAKKIVCIEYQRRNRLRTGFAVYKTDQNVVWIDNSWVWQRTCGIGKYGRLRDGRDVTEAVSAALKARPAQPVVSAARVVTAPAAPRGVALVPVPGSTPDTSAPIATAAPAPRATLPAPPAAAAVTPPATPPVTAASAPVPAVIAAPAVVVVQTPTPTPTPVGPSVAAMPAPVPTVAAAAPTAYAAAPPAAASVPQPTPIPATATPAAQSVPGQAAAPPPAPVSQAHVVPVLIPQGEIGTIRGVTIIDNRGALGNTAPPVTESLGDAARRLRRTKQPAESH